MMYDPNKEFTFCDYGFLPTISVGDLVILIETEDLMTGNKTYNIEPDNGRGICDSHEYQTYIYHGTIRTVDDISYRVKGLHKVLAISDTKEAFSPKAHRNITVSADLKEEWE